MAAKERIDREVLADAAIEGQLALRTTEDRTAGLEEPTDRDRLALVRQIATARVTELLVAAGPRTLLSGSSPRTSQHTGHVPSPAP